MRAFLHTIWARIRGFLRHGAHDAELDDELAFHLAAAEADAIGRGMPADEARRAARIQLGGLTQLREASRAASGLPWLDSLSVDLKLGARLLVKYPGLTIVSTLAMAIAIAIVAGFHAGTEFMVHPVLPVPEGDRVVAIWNHDARTAERAGQTVGDMLAWRRELVSVRDVGAFVRRERVVTAADGATRVVRSADISPSVFRTLRVPPALGRPLVDDDGRPDSPPVVVLGFDVWHSAFGGDTGIVGKRVRVGGVEHGVVGVMPAGFLFPGSEQLWTPLRVASQGLRPGEGTAVDFSVGRLAPDATLDQAEAELEVIGSRFPAGPPGPRQLRPRVASYARAFFDAGEPGLAWLMRVARVLIGIVLLVVAVNVATLVYARDAARVGEVAVRMALGARRSRIVLQMWLEALVLASLAAVVGLAILAWPLYLLGAVFDTAAAQDGGSSYFFDVGLGPRTLLLVAGLVVVAAALTGILPALKLTGRDVRSALQQVQSGISGLRFGRVATVVIVSQVALSVALLTVGAAQLRAFVDTGSLAASAFDPSHYLTAQLRWDIAAPVAGGSDGPGEAARQRDQTRRALGRQIAGEPDVRGVTFAAFNGVAPFARRGDAAGPDTGSSSTYVVSIDANYFEVYDVPIRAGRTFEAAEATAEARRVAVVNEEFVRRVLPAGPAIGQRIHPIDPRSGRPAGDALEIVGVAGDVLDLEISERGPAWAAMPTVYVPMRATMAPIRMTIRVRDDPMQVVERLRAIAARVDPAVVVHQPMPLAESRRIDVLFVRLYSFGVGFLVVAVLVLSTAGVYSMLSFTVSQRTREIGIRTALGASRGRVAADVFRRAFVQVGSGTLLGLAMGYAASAGPFSLSPGLVDDGPGVMIGVAAVMLAAGLVACATPLRKMLCIQPTEALRLD